MRVGIICIQHESNTFLRRRTTLDDFRHDRLLVGEEIRVRQASAHHEVGGFFDGLSAEGIDAVPILMAVAVPSGVVAREATEDLLAMALEQLDRAGPLDGLLVAPHGAAVAEHEPDMDGYWLSRVRSHVGGIPIICTLDLHANVSRRMIDACDAVLSYRTNPHLDQRERGIEAARLVARAIRSEVQPTTAFGSPPMVIGIERQLTRDDPCLSLMKKVDEIRHRPRVLAASANLGFPYADVPEMGCSLVVVTDADPDAARHHVEEIAAFAWENREDFRPHLISIDDAIDAAAAATASSARPVCLLDMGDNVGGGSAGDSTFLAHALHRRGDLRTFICIFDAEAVASSRAAGIGARVNLSVGGKTDEHHGTPLVIDAIVRSLHEGRFSENAPRHGGRTEYDMGLTAIVQTPSNLTIQLTSRRIAPFSLQQILSCDLDPSELDVIIAKGVHGPVAAYETACPTFIRVNTPGSTSADCSSLNFHRRRRPLFPFENC